VPKEEYKEQGREVLLGDLPAYIAGDLDSNTAVVVAYDIYGFTGNRTRAICDELAQAGHLVVLPDFFRGERWTAQREAEEQASKPQWIKARSAPDNIIVAFANQVWPFLTRAHASRRVGLLGFCWGGYASFLLAGLTYPSHLTSNADGGEHGERALACAVGVHSALRLFNANVQGSDAVSACRVLRCPALLMQAGNDPAESKPGAECHRALLESIRGSDCAVEEFPEMLHGWVPRGDLADPAVSRDVAKAMARIKTFLSTHL